MQKGEFKILVADDDAMVREVVERFLSEQGYSVVTANDGLDAVRLLRLKDMHLVLTDLRMPGADGMEVLRTAMQINPRMAVVILTAYGSLDTALDAVKEGAYDYIVKPFVMQQLLLVVRNACRMANLIEENERLSNQLRVTHRSLEVKTAGAGNNPAVSKDPMERIEKLKDLKIIDADEAAVLKERLTSGDGRIKKYSSLIDDLKKEF
ncbi:MAG: response regulator [Nitrospiraceae bacterium]|nr:MAG: response regulator [Nitrospiraceae bacterium]